MHCVYVGGEVISDCPLVQGINSINDEGMDGIRRIAKHCAAIAVPRFPEADFPYEAHMDDLRRSIDEAKRNTEEELKNE